MSLSSHFHLNFIHFFIFFLTIFVQIEVWTIKMNSFWYISTSQFVYSNYRLPVLSSVLTSSLCAFWLRVLKISLYVAGNSVEVMFYALQKVSIILRFVRSFRLLMFRFNPKHFASNWLHRCFKGEPEGIIIDKAWLMAATWGKQMGNTSQPQPKMSWVLPELISKGLRPDLA